MIVSRHLSSTDEKMLRTDLVAGACCIYRSVPQIGMLLEWLHRELDDQLLGYESQVNAIITRILVILARRSLHSGVRRKVIPYRIKALIQEITREPESWGIEERIPMKPAEVSI